MKEINLTLENEILYFWRIKPHKKTGLGQLLGWLLAIVFMPIGFFLVYALIGLLSEGLAKGIAIFFGVATFFPLLLFPMFRLYSKDLFPKELTGFAKNWQENLTTVYFVMAIGSILFLIKADYYGLADAFSGNTKNIWQLSLFYLDTLLAVISFSISEIYEVQLGNIIVVGSSAKLVNTLVNFLAGAGVVTVIVQIFSLNKEVEFTGTMSDCYHKLGYYNSFVSLKNFTVEIEGVIDELPVAYNSRDFYAALEKTSMFKIKKD